MRDLMEVLSSEVSAEEFVEVVSKYSYEELDSFVLEEVK